ncbi:MAG: AMP-binding protein [Hymenobacteraceae bacterium]|nr:AMP-binding protein [Hymenobacteraceae bacterium]
MRYTAAEVLGQVSHARRYLRAQGVRPGQRVLVAVPVGPALVAALLALLALGAIAVLPPAGAGWLTRLRLPGLAGATAAVVASRPRLARRWLARRLGVRLLTVPGAELARPGHAAPLPTWEPAPVPSDQSALISHSSGSTTGRTKPIFRTHAVLAAQHAALQRAFPPWPGQRDFPLFPNILLHNLALPGGVCSVLPAVPWRYVPAFDPARVAAQLVSERIETLTGNVTYFRRLLPALRPLPASALGHVRAVGIGGSPVPEALAQALRTVFSGADLVIIYGSSEAEPIATRRLTAAPTDPRRGYCVGMPAAGVELDLLATGRQIVLPDGRSQAVGEVRVRGAHVAQPAGASPEAWLATGDFGYLEAATGALWLTARRGNTAVVGGCQHYLLEHVAQQVPGVGRVGARPTESGFRVWVEGTDPAVLPAVLAALTTAFPALRGHLQLQLQARLPVDGRHHAKIRYDQLG